MKNWFITLYLSLLSFPAISQTGTIEIEGYLRHRLVQFYFNSDTEALFAGDSSIALKYNPQKYLPYADSLQAGTYTIRYQSVFKQPFEQTFYHDGHSVQTITVYFDDYREDTAAFVLTNQLNTGDTLDFSFYAYGCEPYDGGTLTVFKDQSGLWASFKQDEKAQKKKRLTPELLQQIARFERQVRDLEHESGGSMTYCYAFSLNGNRVFEVKNASGEWAGMQMIKTLVFGG